MTKNPLINALAATFFITIVASIMFYGTQQTAPVRSVIAPIAVVSLFILSAAVMAYIFLYQPFVLYFDGKKNRYRSFSSNAGCFWGNYFSCPHPAFLRNFFLNSV